MIIGTWIYATCPEGAVSRDEIKTNEAGPLVAEIVVLVIGRTRIHFFLLSHKIIKQFIA